MTKRKKPKNDDPFENMMWAVSQNNIEAVQSFAPKLNLKKNEKPLVLACDLGFLDIVKFLAPRSDVTARSGAAFRMAAIKDNVDVLKILLSYQPQSHTDTSLILAAQYGNINAVKLLVNHRDPRLFDSQALQWAAHNGHFSVVHFLIPLSNPKASSSLALQWAFRSGYQDVLELLVPHSDIQEAIDDVKKNNKFDEEKRRFFDYFSKSLATKKKIEEKTEKAKEKKDSTVSLRKRKI